MSAHKVIIPACKVSYHNGRYALEPPVEMARYFGELLKYAYKKRGGFISAIYDLPKRPRTTGRLSQSAHFNGHCQTISNETGQPMDDVRKFIKARAVSRGYPMLKNEKGEPLLDLWGAIQGASEAKASVEEAKLLIDEVHQFAAEEGIILIEGENE